MSIPVPYFRWLAPYLAAVAFALAPQFAAAHTEHANDAAGPGAAAIAANQAAPVSVDAAQRPDSATWSSSCPSGHGNSCCCHIPTACSGGSQAPVVSFGGWVRAFLWPAGRATRSPLESVPQPQLALSPALPRAPPLFS